MQFALHFVSLLDFVDAVLQKKTIINFIIIKGKGKAALLSLYNKLHSKLQGKNGGLVLSRCD